MVRKTMFIVVAVLCLAGVWALWGDKKAPAGAKQAQPVRMVHVVTEQKQKQKAEGATGSKDMAPTPAPAPLAEKSVAKSASKSIVSGKVSAGSPGLAPRSLDAQLGTGLGGLGLRGSGSGGGGGVGHGSAVGMGMVGRGRVISVGPINVGGSAAEPTGGEGYHNHGVNPFVDAKKDRLSTFAVDVDTASYTIARRKILEGTPPPKDSVRVEEFLNYFHYSYPAPVGHPLAVFMDAAPSPFNPGRHLLRVGVQGKKLSLSERKPAHLTFLVDVSGSMQSADKLPLAKRSLRLLVDNLKDGDTVALVTYASGVRLVLPPTGLERKVDILAAIEDLHAGGSTAMASGIDLAYKQAMKTLDGKSVSRVLILSDGDTNIGSTSHEEISKMIRGYVKEGVTLSTFGFGMGNYKDDMMEQLADRGNGNYFYVDSVMQARRIFQEQAGGTLEVIAQDVKLQVEFDPAQVLRYRLVGYENRDIADEDFRNDKVDAGELGAGHTVTALYELELARDAPGQGLATVRIRAKQPRGEKADEAAYEFPRAALSSRFEDAAPDLRFAAAVMASAEILRQSPHAAGWSYDQVVKLAKGATPAGNAEREEFVSLLEKARSLVSQVASR